MEYGLCDFLKPSEDSENTNSYWTRGKETEEGRRWAVEIGKKEDDRGEEKSGRREDEGGGHRGKNK